MTPPATLERPTHHRVVAGSDFIKRSNHYRKLFVKHHGPFPHPCCFCGETVSPWAGQLDSAAPSVHHIDGDPTNDDPANLAAAHHGCNSSDGSLKSWQALDAEGRAARQRPRAIAGATAANAIIHAEKLPDGRSRCAVEAGKKGGPKGAAAVHAQKDGRGKSKHAVKMGRNSQAKKSPAERSAHSRRMAGVTNSQRWKCNDCEHVTSPGPMGLHHKAVGHVGKTRVV